jgi:IclR family mhp operon transcriptional activator
VLQLLEAVSSRGTADLPTLQQATGLPKPTMIRLLSTLVRAGYVRHVSRRGGYALAEGVLRLSAGLLYADRVVSSARGHLDFFTATYKWPVGIATFHRGALRLRYGTYAQSPFATNIPILDRKLPMLTSAHGRVYFAFCSDVERKIMLESLRAPSHPENPQARDARRTLALIRSVRARGYSLRDTTPNDRVGGLAVPVLHRDNVVATVSMRYFRTAVSSDEVVDRYLGPLQDLAAEIAAELKQPRPKRS